MYEPILFPPTPPGINANTSPTSLAANALKRRYQWESYESAKQALENRGIFPAMDTRAFLGYPYPRIPATGPYFNDLQMSQLPNNYPAAYHPYIYQHHNLVRRDAEAEPQSSYNDTYVGYRVGMMGLGPFGFKGIMPYMATPFAVWGRPFG